MKRIYTLLMVTAVISCTIFSSCVTIFGSYKKVHISSSPSGASIYRDDGEYVGQTPIVYYGKAHHNFYLAKTGYEDAGIYPDYKFNPLYLLNIPLLYGLLEFNNINTFKEKESYYNVTLKPKQTSTYTPTYTPATVKIPSLLESVSAYTDSYICNDAYSRIKPTYSSSTSNKVVMKGSEIFKKYNNAVFMIYGTTSKSNKTWQGSGFIVSSDGLAVSNYHVFDGANEIGIKFYGSESLYKITKDDILAFNKKEDYIIFKVRGRYNYPYIPIANQRNEVGDRIYTISSPKGLENTFSSGEISQYRTRDGYIQITAPIDHGSSGGVLINEYGEAIGITTGGRDDSGANLNFCRDLLYIMNRFK